MFPFTYDEWFEVCNMYLNLKYGVQQSYLQWYPFSVLSELEKEQISSEEYFNKYIKTGLFAINKKHWIVTENYIQKGDGGFRNSVLIAPVLYLVLQCIGKHISKFYISLRAMRISTYYAGNIPENRCYYKQDYDDFFKLIISEQENYKYYIKTDIQDFYNNINNNKLFEIIDGNVNKYTQNIKQKDLLLFKEIINYCGINGFPLADNSVASSYLATYIYLDNIDQRIFSYLLKEKGISNFHMIRYVDDLYILFNSQEEIQELNLIYNELLCAYSSILKEYNLTLNARKTVFKNTSQISEDIKKSLYDEYVNGQICVIGELVSVDKILTFFDQIQRLIIEGNFSHESYNTLIDSCFSIEALDFTSNEVLNYFLYDKKGVFKNVKIIEKLKNLLNRHIGFIRVDPKRIVNMIMNTKNTELIKILLNGLFERYRTGQWNSFDTTIAIHYFLNSKFKHRDLLTIVKENLPLLYQYFTLFCFDSFLLTLHDSLSETFFDKVFFRNDIKIFYLLIMYRVELLRSNYMAAFAYYKNFFDRMTSHIAYATNYDNNGRCPNYKKFYKEGELKKFYSDITNADQIIDVAHRYRNDNPLAHSGAALIDSDNTTLNLLESIQNLAKIIRDKIHNDIV